MRTFNLSAAAARGSALVLVLIVCTILAGVTLLVIQQTRTEDMATETLRYSSAYDSLSEAATEYAIRQIANNIAANMPLQSPGLAGGQEVWNPMPSITVCGVTVYYTFRRLNDDGTPTYLDSSGKAGPAPYDANGRPTVRYYNILDSNVSPSNNAPPARYESRDPQTDQWIAYNVNSPGYVRYIYPYKITATVNYSPLIGGPHGVVDTTLRASIVNKIMEFHAQPLWQFFAFWGGNTDLEITTGPKSCFMGRIHANKSIYLGNDSYSAGNHQIYITNYLRTAAKLNHSRFDNYGSVTNPVTPRPNNGATGGGVWIKRYGQGGAGATVTNPVTNDYFNTRPGGTGTDGKPVYNMLESKYYWDTLASPTVPSFTGFDSQFTGYDRNANGVYTDPVDTPPFLQRAPSLYDGTVETGAQGVKPMSVPKINSIRSFDVQQGQGYRFDNATHQLKLNGNVVTNPPLGSYYSQAKASGLVIQTNSSNSTTITLNGTTIPAADYASGGKYDGLVTYPQMVDNRESKTVKLTQVSMKILNQVLEDYNVPTTNGILAYGLREDTLDSYLSGTPTVDPVTGVTTYAAPSTRSGFRLVDGTLLRNPFTLVSEDPVYMMGDFNTGQNRKFVDTGNDTKDDSTNKYMLYDLVNQGPTNDWTNWAKTVDTEALGAKYRKSDGTTYVIDAWKDIYEKVYDTTTDTVRPAAELPVLFQNKTKDQIIDILNARTRKQGSSIIADAVNLLSNAWTTTTQDPATTLTNRVASNTIFNFAMLSGQVPTVLNSYYSGGMENYPRFHENWSSKTCNYRGSFVNLYNSVMAKERWGKSNVYSPPGRLWAFDKDFETFSKLPPFFPMAVGAARVVWWK